MDLIAFKEHLFYIREALKPHIPADQHWFQFLSNNQEALTLPHPYPISIRPAKYGRGVFADCNIPSRTVITIYPAHYLCERVKGNEHTVCHPQGLPPMVPAYRITLTDKLSIVGCPDITNHPWFLGHMMNDPCDFSLLKKGNEGKWLLHYAEQKANVRWENDGDCVYVVTTQDIKAGEELLISYGVDYWFVRAGLPTYLSQKAKRLHRIKGHN
jgi:hypothetical protein